MIDWKFARVEECVFNGAEIGSSLGKLYAGYAYKISFKSSKEGILGPIVVYLDKNSYKFLGIALRD